MPSRKKFRDQRSFHASIGEAISFPYNFSLGYGAGDCAPRASAFPEGETLGSSLPDSIMVGRIGPIPSSFSGRDLDVRDLFCSTGVCLFTSLGVSEIVGACTALTSDSDPPVFGGCGADGLFKRSAASAPAAR